MTVPAYDHAVLQEYARTLLQRAGLEPSKATTVAEILVEGDLLGHTTHGLALLPGYLNEIAEGRMTRDGDPVTVGDRGAAVTWDGRRLPGPWLTVRAIDLATERALLHGTATVVIRRSHHIACLAAYLRRATDRGLVLLLMSSDPAVRSVAPYGGTRALFTPNPIAAGYPTNGEPVLMDISTSTTTNGLTNRLKTEGRRLDEPWLLDAAGHPSDDPAVLFTDPPGTIQPLGGLSAGHKGFALALLVETLTSALGGFGRADPAEGWGASVFVQVIDPQAFGGRDAFLRETGWMADAVRATPPIAATDRQSPVRLPGSRGLQLREQQTRDGLRLYPSIMPALQPWADRLRVDIPTPLT